MNTTVVNVGLEFYVDPSGNYRSHASLDKFINKFSSKIGTPYILYTKDLMVKDNILHLPIYMAMFL